MNDQETIDIGDFKKVLKVYPKYFLQFNGKESVTDGWKLSIQGKTLDDSVYLAENLIDLLFNKEASFKFGTQKLIDLKHPQQSTKLLTIYIPNKADPKVFSELVKNEILDYKGAEGINTPESYNTYSKELGIYYRNDRDEEGNYIAAN